jgi:hypothetical protein
LVASQVDSVVFIFVGLGWFGLVITDYAQSTQDSEL